MPVDLSPTLLLQTLLTRLGALEVSAQAGAVSALAEALSRVGSGDLGTVRDLLSRLEDGASPEETVRRLARLVESIQPSPAAVRLNASLEGPFHRPGPLTAALWRTRVDEARAEFERWFYPQGAVTRLADLGAGAGDFSILLARRYPTANVWSVDWNPITFLSNDGPSNILNCGGYSFEIFRDVVLRGPDEPLRFDRVYIVMPNLVSVLDFVQPAMEVVADQGEIHLLTEGLHAADAARISLEASGFEVRRMAVPLDVVPQVAGTRYLSDDSVPWLYWVVARRRGSGSLVMPSRPSRVEVPPFPEQLLIRDVPIEDHHDPRISDLLFDLFHFPLHLDDLLWAFSLKGTGYHLARLAVSERQNGDIAFWGAIANEGGELAWEFTRVVPKPPGSGLPWVASGEGFDLWEGGERNAPRRSGAGVARPHLQRFLTFLADLGVDRLRLAATKDGSYVWAHLGFDFAGYSAREDLKWEFLDWLRNRKIGLSPQKVEELRWLVHVWQLADFADEGGTRLGREFLLWRGWNVPFGWEAAFFLRPDFEGWRRLTARTGAPGR